MSLMDKTVHIASYCTAQKQSVFVKIIMYMAIATNDVTLLVCYIQYIKGIGIGL